jgi:tetratricopeptide (TPR) repeat protein
MDRAARLAPGDLSVLFLRGLTLFLERRYAEAELDFEAAYRLSLVPAEVQSTQDSTTGEFPPPILPPGSLARHRFDESMQYAFFLAFTRRQLGRHADAEVLLRDYAEHSSEWPGILARYLLGEASETKVLADGMYPYRLCEASFYIAYVASLAGETNKAKEFLERSVDTQLFGKAEHLAAHVMLTQLETK